MFDPYSFNIPPFGFDTAQEELCDIFIFDDEIEPANESAKTDALTYYQTLRRLTRTKAGVPPESLEYGNVCLVTESLLTVNKLIVTFSFDETISSAIRMSWMTEMREEIASLEEKCVWSLVDLPKGRRTVKTKWIYNMKLGSNEEILQLESHLVEKGFP